MRMRTEYNIYCDESCHLENDQSKAMVLGAVWCLKDVKYEVFERIREIKVKYGFKPDFEIKWNKVSKARNDFYLELINYFFDDDDLHFRGLVVPDKTLLNHRFFNQDHNTFYYKMYLDLLKVILAPHNGYNIYIDIKDTKGQEKVLELQNVLRNNHYDYQNQIIRKIQQVHSHEIELLQITDLLCGALSYLHRGLKGNEAKLHLIDRIRYRSGYSLLKSTLYREEKMNVFIWKAKESNNGRLY
ncbi:Protein of unknown function [Tangfeifania diversioriginum]|uniref:DUF3800 domain-containing protein n=2 Tax=Tangfeifania diversioriginum TaxID=1168035 RepID=A0A1M6JMK4_9BACT|nr:Protein of unknown function [Tangfeifania diversioriginum]